MITTPDPVTVPVTTFIYLQLRRPSVPKVQNLKPVKCGIFCLQLRKIANHHTLKNTETLSYQQIIAIIAALLLLL